MSKPKRNPLLWFVATGVTLSLVGVGIHFVQVHRASLESESAGRDVLAGAPGEKPVIARLEALKWAEVEATVEGSCAEPARTQEVLVATVATTNSPTLFLRGLLLLGKGDQTAALQAFESAPIQTIPATYLYAPYRLQSELHPAKPNPFRAPLLRAAEQGQLPPLIEARVLAREANPQPALKGYLRSDPSAWTAYDLELFPFLLQHAGVERETRAMLLAALRAGRVKQELRGRIESLALGQPDAAAATAFKSNLCNLLKGDADSRELAGRIAIHQLEIRRQFLAKQYRQLLREHATADAAGQPDETVLLLTLSAARQADTPALDRWSQEIKRRYPQPEVEQWIKGLRLAAK